jgi:hypothetical protein
MYLFNLILQNMMYKILFKVYRWRKYTQKLYSSFLASDKAELGFKPSQSNSRDPLANKYEFHKLSAKPIVHSS